MVSAKPTNGSRVWSAAILVVALLGASLGAVAAPPQPEDEGLFSGVAADGANAVDDPAVVRSRPVTVDLARLGAPDAAGVAERLTLNFFSDAVYTAVLDRVERNPSGSFSWIGHLEGVELSAVTLVVKDGVMVGNAIAPGLFYQVRYAGEGVHAVREADQAAFPPEAEPIPVEPPEGTWDQPIDGAPADDGSTIDVLVIYTNVARAAAGGTIAIQNLIQTAEDETNQGYANSGITQRIDVVHTAEVSYDETGFNWNTTLSRFRAHGDGYFDAVTQPTTGLRDTYAADESVLIVSQSYSSICGMGYMMDPVGAYFESSAFVVVASNCATGYYSFGHELGHTMGARHDRYVDSSNTPYPYSHGYVNAPNRWRTIMAYNNECASGGFNCTRLNYWSNPDVSYGGQPMGVAYTEPDSADNRLTLNNTAYTVANFRVANHPPNTPGSPTPADGATGQSVNVDLGWTGGDPDAGDTVTYDVYLEAGDATPDHLACAGTSATTCDPGALARGVHYYWRVVATDSHDESTTGPVWDFTINRLPNAPSNPTPTDGATDQSLDANLSWTGGDPDAGDVVTYDVYFKDSGSAYARICDDASTPACDPGPLALNGHYYWYVVASDNHGESTTGPEWDFYAITNDPPNTPSFPLPADGASGESVDVSLAWTGGDPDAGDTVTYTVHLGTSSPPGSPVCQGSATACDPSGSLAPNTHYYWQVAAVDSYGETTTGPVWDFTTGTATGPTIRGYVRDSSLGAVEGVTVTFSGPLTTTTGSDGYYAQAGFGGGAVTVTVEAAGYTFSPWLDQVTVAGDVTHHVTAYPLAPTLLLFSDGFESASYNLGGAWAVETDYEGRVGISSAYSHQGSYSLLLDDDTGAGFTSHASAILPLVLSGETQVKLSFWWRAFQFESLPDDNGVFISDNDGLTWTKVFTFTRLDDFSHVLIDLDEEAANAGLTLNDQFLVKFQIYENYPAPSDGCAIDDVTVYGDEYNVHLPVVLDDWP